jgi:hypothetical protein
MTEVQKEGVREGEPHTCTHTHTHTYTHTHTHKNTQRKRERDTETHTHREREREWGKRHRESDRDRDREMIDCDYTPSRGFPSLPTCTHACMLRSYSCGQFTPNLICSNGAIGTPLPHV